MSEMSATRVEKASEIVDVGEQVWIKVIGREVTTHTHTHPRCAVLCQWSEQDDCNSVRFPSDSGGQGEVVLLNESCQSGNGAGHGSKQCHGRVSASVVFFSYVYVSAWVHDRDAHSNFYQFLSDSDD